MKIKSSVNLIAILLVLLSSNLRANNIAYSSLIMQPYNKITSTGSRINRWGLSSIVGLGAGYLINKYLKLGLDNNLLQDIDYENRKTQIISALAGSTIGALTLALSTNSSESSFKAQAAERFIKNWPSYRARTPQELHNICQHYFEIYKQDPEDFRDQAVTFVSIIEQMHTKEEPSFYNKIKGFFNSKHFSANADLGSSLRGVADVIRAVKPR